LGSDFWWIFWLIIGTLIVLLNLFYTSLLLPLFNKLTPLEAGDLKTAIQKYCAEQHFPLDNVYILDGSKRSNKANAFFSGIGKKKKIVLYDTLIQQQSTEEIVAVLAHEAGHYKKKHVVQMMFFAVIQMGAYLYVLSLMYNNTAISLAMGGQAAHIGLNLIAYGILFTPISIVTGILMNMWSRKNEFEADAFAVDTYPGPYLANALKKLSKENLSNLTPHPAYTFVHYSHPPMSIRLQAMDNN
jgi:STE24 endopeptidase